MNEPQELTGNMYILVGFGARFAPNNSERLVGKTGEFPSSSVDVNTLHKLLKIETLRVFHFGSEMPFLRQAKGLAKIGNTLGHVLHVGLTAHNEQRLNEEHLSKVRQRDARGSWRPAALK